MFGQEFFVQVAHAKEHIELGALVHPPMIKKVQAPIWFAPPHVSASTNTAATTTASS